MYPRDSTEAACLWESRSLAAITGSWTACSSPMLTIRQRIGMIATRPRCSTRKGTNMRITRREFTQLGAASLVASAVPQMANAAGPLADMPAGAIDCHNHIVGPQSKYPMAADRTYTPPEASVVQLLALRKELGVARNVIVQPSFYGFDNSCLVDALAELGPSARGIAVVPQSISNAELQRLWHAGVTGVRLNLAPARIRDPQVALDAIK